MQTQYLMNDAVQRAVNKLLYAGMVLRYQSRHGHSCYLGWPGRRGTLRVSDHTNTRCDTEIMARLTLNETSTPTTEENFTAAVAEALGRYLLKTESE